MGSIGDVVYAEMKDLRASFAPVHSLLKDDPNLSKFLLLPDAAQSEIRTHKNMTHCMSSSSLFL